MECQVPGPKKKKKGTHQLTGALMEGQYRVGSHLPTAKKDGGSAYQEKALYPSQILSAHRRVLRAKMRKYRQGAVGKWVSADERIRVTERDNISRTGVMITELSI